MPSRLFSGGYVWHASAILSAYPWSFLAWVNVASGASGVDTIFSIYNASTTNTGWTIESNSGKACFRSSLSGTAPTATVATAFTAGTWQPVLAMAASATDRRIYAISRSNSATNTTSNTPTSLSRTAIGTRFSSAAPEYNFAGQIAHPTLWSIADFSDEEIDALFAGADPLVFRPAYLAAAPTIYTDSPENDLAAARSWTVTGTTTKEDGPPVWRAQKVRRRNTSSVSSANNLTARISSGDTYYAADFPLIAADKGKMAVAIVTLDDSDQSISVELNERTAVTSSPAVAFNAQTGDLIIGADLNDGVPTDSSSTTAWLHTARAFSHALTEQEREDILDAIADDLAPRVVGDYIAEISSTEQTNIDLTEYVQDTTGTGWSVTAIDQLDEGCTAQASGKTVNVTPLGGEGVTSFIATVTNQWVRPRSGVLYATLTKLEGADPTDAPSSWTWNIPWLPASNSDIHVYEVQPNGNFKRNGITYTKLDGLGAGDQLALLVAPTTAITGGLAMRNTRYRGVVMVGATVRFVGPNLHYWSGVTNKVRWGHFINLSFTGSAQSDRPFGFFANIDWEATNSLGGDFFRTGTVGNNQDTWCDTYLQRIKIAKGHYFGNLDTARNLAEDPNYNQIREGPHSDFAQSAYGNVNNFYFANNDIAWAGQHYFHRPETGEVRIGSKSLFRKCTSRPMPHNSVVQGAKPHNRPKYIDFIDGGTTDYNAGEYHAFDFANCIGVEDPDSNATGLGSYFDSSGLTAVVNNTAKTVSWPTPAKSPNTLKPATGSWKFETNPTNQAGTIIGSQYRITTAAALRSAAGL